MQIQYQFVCLKCNNLIQSEDSIQAHSLVCYARQRKKLQTYLEIIKLDQNLSGQKWKNQKKYWKRKWKKFAREVLQEQRKDDQIEIEINEEQLPQKQQQQKLIDNRLQCPFCNKIYASRYNLTRHFAKIHYGLKEFGQQKKN